MLVHDHKSFCICLQLSRLKMHLWDRCLSRSPQTGLISQMELEPSLNVRQEETHNRISSGSVPMEPLWETFPDCDRYCVKFLLNSFNFYLLKSYLNKSKEKEYKSYLNLERERDIHGRFYRDALKERRARVVSVKSINVINASININKIIKSINIKSININKLIKCSQ